MILIIIFHVLCTIEILGSTKYDRAVYSENFVEPLRLGKGRRITHKSYYRYGEISLYIRELAEKYSPTATVETIGETSEGRDLEVIKICSDGCGFKHIIFVDCGIHAREWLSPATCVYIIQQLVENMDNSYMLEDTDWYIIPLLNPDGYEFSHTDDRMWRKTRSQTSNIKCVGVDPNRNFDFHWDVVGTSRDECEDDYSGPESFSEPETRAFRDFVLAHKDYIKLYISFHSYGQYILYSWGWTTELPDNVRELDDLGNEVAAAIKAYRGSKYTVGSPAILMYEAAGGSDDWMKGVVGVPLSYTIELPGGRYNGFISHSTNILPVVKETFEGMKVFQDYVAVNFND